MVSNNALTNGLKIITLNVFLVSLPGAACIARVFMSYEETGEVNFTISSKSNPSAFLHEKGNKRAYRFVNVQKDRLQIIQL